eukprot:scaffold79944_cov29-Tisochrysis_lutea.AAC.5
MLGQERRVGKCEGREGVAQMARRVWWARDMFIIPGTSDAVTAAVKCARGDKWGTVYTVGGGRGY